MKSYIIPLGLLLMLICATLPITAAPTLPTVRLPNDMVTMNAVYGKNSWFTMTLTDIPLGFDITNGTNQGWCVQKTIHMTQKVNHAVLLYSSSNPSLPQDFQIGNWDKINYILNHKFGNRDSIQKAIWYYSNNEDCSSDVDAQTMVDDAEQYGAGFIPKNGEKIAIPIEGVPTIQLTFLELIIPTPSGIEGLVWDDSNANGLQNEGESGIQNVMVHLYQSDNLLLNTTTTNSKGCYSFMKIHTGEYYLKVVLPTGYIFSPKNVGSNDAVDSDFDATGKTVVFTITINESNSPWDAGMYKTSPKRSSSHNHPPTADATAGEPYTGFAHSVITFDGSRSYDRDGRIISWRWIFGDGTNGTGAITNHIYDHPGNYTVTLTVNDNWVASDVYATTARITLGNNPPSKPVVLGPTQGHVNIANQYTVVSTDPDRDTLQYMMDWGDGLSNTSPFFESGNSISTTHEWNTQGFYTMRIYAQDESNAISEIYEMIIPIDVQYVGNLGYLIDSNSDGIFDSFQSNTTAKETKVSRQANGNYLIDTNGDGTWDIVYNPITSQYQEYQDGPILDYLLFVILVITFVLILYLGGKKKRSRTLSNTHEGINTSKNK